VGGGLFASFIVIEGYQHDWGIPQQSLPAGAPCSGRRASRDGDHRLPCLLCNCEGIKLFFYHDGGLVASQSISTIQGVPVLPAGPAYFGFGLLVNRRMFKRHSCPQARQGMETPRGNHTGL
jgi:hypothetical protein